MSEESNVGSDIETLLRCAALEGEAQKVQTLLEQGADVQSHNFQKNTALHMATQYGHGHVVRLLLRHGADPDATNTNGQTALQLACAKGHLDIVKMMTQHGCDLHLQNDFSAMTALHYASKAGEADICQHLLDTGADEDIPDTIGKIAEFYAANYPTELVFRKRKGQKGQKKEVQKHKQETVRAAPIMPPVRAPVVSSQSKPKTPERSPPPVSETKRVKNEMNVREVSTKQTHKPPSPEPTRIPEQAPKSHPQKSSTPEPREQARGPSPQPTVPEPASNTEAKKFQAPVPAPEDKLKPPTNSPTARLKQREADEKSLSSTSRDSTQWDRDPTKYNHSPGGGNVKIENRKLNWKAKSSGYGQGVLKRNDLERRDDKDFEWSEEFKQRQQKSVFDRLLAGGKKHDKTADNSSQDGGGQARSRDRSPAKPLRK